MAAIRVRNALVVARPEEGAGLASLVRRAGWGGIEADGLGHARFLLSMTACDGVVVGDLAGPVLLDGLAWLAAQLPAPPILVVTPGEDVVLATLRHGVLWVPPDALRACPALLGALLEQAASLGDQRPSRAARADADRAEIEARAGRLRDMLWEAAPVEGPARWFTQRHMLERLDEEVERSRRNGTPLSVVLGEVVAPPGSILPREQADQLAGWLAAAVGRGKRRSDVAGHYGTHGFMMVLPQTTAEQALATCRRLSRVLRHPPHPGPPGVRPCFALADVRGKQASVPALLRRAEECLDQARAGAGEVVAG